MRLPEKDWPVLPTLSNKIVNVSTLFSVDTGVKNKIQSPHNYSGDRFLSLIAYFSDFDRMIRSFCYLFRVFKSWLIKDIAKRSLFFNLNKSPLTVKERL